VREIDKYKKPELAPIFLVTVHCGYCKKRHNLKALVKPNEIIPNILTPNLTQINIVEDFYCDHPITQEEADRIDKLQGLKP
jgi:hypothetical protein